MKTIYTLIASTLVFFGIAAYTHAATIPAPVITNITATTATVSVAATAIPDNNASGVYFQYYETNQVCIMIYPTPENCKPKQTAQGVYSTTLSNLKPQTSYTVVFKRDNTIRCITTPCPGNDFESESVTFVTLPASQSNAIFLRNLRFGSRGTEVIALQTVLREKGYLIFPSTGYYSVFTRAAVRMYQQNDMHIAPTGTVGPLTRASLNAMQASVEEKFSGSITAVSTSCFADGICSVTVDGKVVVTTIGWTQGPLGSIKGTSTDIGSLESRIGAKVNVYAKKTADGYTLYGKNDYYIEVL